MIALLNLLVMLLWYQDLSFDLCKLKAVNWAVQ